MSIDEMTPPVKPRRGRPPDANSEQTKEHILRAARRLFASRGYLGTTTRMISSGAGVTTAALHHYFGRKRDLALEAWRLTTHEQFAWLNAKVNAQSTFSGKVAALLDSASELSGRDRERLIFIVSMQEEARRTADLSEIVKDTRWVDLVSKIIDFGVETGDVDPNVAQSLRGALFATLFGANLLAMDLGSKRAAVMIDGCKRLFQPIRNSDTATQGTAPPAGAPSVN